MKSFALFLLPIIFPLFLAQPLPHRTSVPSYSPPTSPHYQTNLLTTTIYLPLITRPYLNTGSIAIVSLWQHFTDDQYLVIFGEVQNQNVFTVYPLGITFNFFDSDDTYLGTKYLRSNTTNLQPDHIACFGGYIYDPPSNWAYYKIEQIEFWQAKPPSSDLVLLSSQGLYDPKTGYYTVLGEVQNTGPDIQDYVRAVITLYDQLDRVTGCVAAYINQNHLDPGEISYFQRTFTSSHIDRKNTTRYKIQIE